MNLFTTANGNLYGLHDGLLYKRESDGWGPVFTAPKHRAYKVRCQATEPLFKSLEDYLGLDRKACCPHCGGKQGYMSSRIVRYEFVSEWGNQDNQAGDCKVLSARKTGMCIDCQKMVKIS